MSRELNKLVVGDEVVRRSRNGTSIEKVERITKTQIVTSFGKFRISDGGLVGAGAWNYQTISIATEETKDDLRKKAHRHKLIRTLRDYNSWDNFTTDKLEEIMSLLEQK